MQVNFEGKRATNKEIFEMFEEQLNLIKRVINKESEDNEKPNQLTTMIMNVISLSLKDLQTSYDIRDLLEAIDVYINIYRFGKKKQRTLLEKTIARFDETLNERGCITPIEFFEILLDITKPLVK